MEEFFKQLNAPVPPVKIEEPDGNEFQRALSVSDPDAGQSPVTGLEAMGEEMEAAQRKEAENAQKLADFMQQDEKEVVKKRKGRTSSDDDDKRDDSKTPLTTFGHSSRPRRSVNYASIERGDEAQSQSLVTQFSTGKKRQKRTRDELDENYQEETKKKTKRRATPWLPPGTPLAPSYAANLLQADLRRAETEFSEVAPSVDADRPTVEDRAIGVMIDSLWAIRRSSGGFRRFVAWLTDDHILKMKELVERRYNMQKDSEDKRIVRTIRHVYNTLPFNYRRDWEYAARMDVFESRHFVQGLAMPMSEILVQSEEEREQKRFGGSAVRANCCSMAPNLADMRQTAEHFALHHDVVHFFGCDFCHRIFATRFELTKHNCNQFCSLLLELTVKGERLEMEAAYMYLCCSQCGLWLPVKASVSGNKGWHYFATALKNHTCQPLCPVVVYFRTSLPEDDKHIRFSFQLMISTEVGFPTRCADCETDEFCTLAEAEQHFKEYHKQFQCTKCPLAFGTEFLWRHHQQTHITQSAQFANYLLYSATYQPPPGSGRRPHIGFQSEIPTIGGCVGPELDAMHAAATASDEFVKPDQNTLRKKMLRWKPTIEKKESRQSSESDASVSSRPSDDSSSSSSSSGSDASSDDVTSNRKKRPKVASPPKKKDSAVRGDLGYEHVRRDELFGRNELEQEAIDRLEKVAQRRLFASGERLLAPGDVVELLDRQGVQEAELGSQACQLADEVAAMTLKTISLPGSNCIDPLKDLLLVNKVFNYCPKCQYVFSLDPLTHSAVCEVDEDTLVELSHAAAGPHSGIKCVAPDCRLHLCSPTSLRTHCQLQHNLNITVETNISTPSADIPADQVDTSALTRYDRSIMTLAKHFSEFQIDERTHLARLTDIDCYLPAMGVLERKYKYGRPTQNPLVRPFVPQTAVTKSANVKPYRIPRTSRWYSCQWCDKEYENLESFVDHLQKLHVFTCLNCGRAFASLSTKRAHTCARTFPDVREKPSMVVRGTCVTCGERHPVDTLYVHALRRHFSTIEYVQATGEILPRVLEPRCELLSMARATASHEPVVGRETRTDFRIKLIRPAGVAVQGVPLGQLNATSAPLESFTFCPPEYNHIDPRLMCYLCELTFDNLTELSNHLDEHPERYASCPFCPFVVDSHFGLQKHLLKQHFTKSQQRMVCGHCGEPQSRFMCSHILYRCKRLPVCTICGQRSHDAAANVQHMQRAHKLLLRRFQCGYCPTVFMSMGEFYEHKCTGFQTRVFSCSCATDKYFSSINAFCDHFDAAHVAKQSCLLCRVDAPSQEVLARHRMTHMKSESVRNVQKRIYILVRWLYPKPNSGYMRWVEGGTPPPSHMHIERNQSAVLMGFGNPAGIPTPPARPVTLFDVLEGPNAASRRDSGGSAPKKTVEVTDVICLSDDDDDEVEKDDSDDIVFEGSVQKTRNGDAALGQVRVEKADGGYGGSQQPGYVDDEVTETTPEDVAAAEPVVKTVVDENADDELAVVAEVENARGTLPSNISAGREKKFKCSQCSMAYFTNQSLQAHVAGHKQDAGGQTSTEEYGLPVDAKAWLCRNCCIAFENFKQYETHTAIHGDTSHSCIHCSGIAFNQTTIVNHMKSHEARQVWYGCGTCLCKFSSDLALMEHLHKVHAVELFYFCKVCGFGTTDANMLFNHIGGHPMSHYTILQRFGACPVQLLHYEPHNEAEFRLAILKKTITLRTPSDCAHRSLLLSNETVVACKTCQCTQPWFNFLAFNNYSEETSMPNFRIAESRPGFALGGHLSVPNQQLMARYANQTRVARVASNTIAVSSATSTRFATIAPSPTVGSILRRAAPASPVVSTTANGARVIRPQPSITNRNAVVVPNPATRRMTLNTRRSPPTSQVHALLPVIGSCQKCSSAINTDYDRLLHNMHASDDLWFCRMCGHSQKSEIELFVHYIREHLTPAYRRIPGFRPNVFRLHCPIDNCSAVNQFMSTKAFEKHINQAHTDLLPYQSSCCDARFRTTELRERHEQRHNEYLETNGTDSTCCTLCGTLDMWSLPKDSETQCLQSHIIRHGLDYRSACRACLKQFPADTNCHQVSNHIRKAHAIAGPQGITCQLCGEMSSNAIEFGEHCKRLHVFNILLKSAHSQRGELVVNTGPEYINFVGLTQDMPKLVSSRGEPVVSADGGNAALLTIAAAIGEEREVHTID